MDEFIVPGIVPGIVSILAIRRVFAIIVTRREDEDVFPYAQAFDDESREFN